MRLTLLILSFALVGCLPWGTRERHAALCGKVTLMEYHRQQNTYREGHGRYAGFLEQLQLDPPVECREDWRYELSTAEGGVSFRMTARQLSTQQRYSVDEKGILREPGDES